MAEYIDKVAFNCAIREAVRRYPNSFYNGLEVARQIAHDFPAAEVRPVIKSKWDDNRVSFYRGCPECGAFVRANLDEVFLRDCPSAVGKLNFCPNCGADMREES